MKRLVFLAAAFAAMCAHAVCYVGSVENVWTQTIDGKRCVCVKMDDPLAVHYMEWNVVGDWPLTQLTNLGDGVWAAEWNCTDRIQICVYGYTSKYALGEVIEVGCKDGVRYWGCWEENYAWHGVQDVGAGGKAERVDITERTVSITVNVVAGSGAWRVETSPDMVTWTNCPTAVFDAGRRFFRVVKAESEVAK